jgi:hypothetical protein
MSYELEQPKQNKFFQTKDDDSTPFVLVYRFIAWPSAESQKLTASSSRLEAHASKFFDILENQEKLLDERVYDRSHNVFVSPSFWWS